MKKILFIILMGCNYLAHSQDNNVLFKEAENLERSFKEPEALDKYKQILTNDAANIKEKRSTWAWTKSLQSEKYWIYLGVHRTKEP